MDILSEHKKKSDTFKKWMSGTHSMDWQCNIIPNQYLNTVLHAKSPFYGIKKAFMAENILSNSRNMNFIKSVQVISSIG